MATEETMEFKPQAEDTLEYKLQMEVGALKADLIVLLEGMMSEAGRALKRLNSWKKMNGQYSLHSYTRDYQDKLSKLAALERVVEDLATERMRNAGKVQKWVEK